MEEKAIESHQVQRAREKLKRTLEVEHQKFTTSALSEMTRKIRTAIQRHHPEPSFLKKRKFTIFSENSNPAKTKSREVLKLQKMLESNF